MAEWKPYASQTQPLKLYLVANMWWHSLRQIKGNRYSTNSRDTCCCEKSGKSTIRGQDTGGWKYGKWEIEGTAESRWYFEQVFWMDQGGDSLSEERWLCEVLAEERYSISTCHEGPKHLQAAGSTNVNDQYCKSNSKRNNIWNTIIFLKEVLFF